MRTPGDKSGSAGARRDVLIGLVVLGSVWGLLEVVLGGAMKAGGVPYRGDVLTGLGMLLMGIALALYRKPAALIGIAAVAIAMRQLSVPILHLSTFCKANSCLAVMLGGAAIAGAAALGGRGLHRKLSTRAMAGFAAGLTAGIAFYFIGMRVAPCPYLLSFNRAGGFAAFMQAESLVWAALCAVLFPAGYRLGETLRAGVFEMRAARPAFYYAASLALVGFAWLASAVAIARGL
jgi:hypothetical protein